MNSFSAIRSTPRYHTCGDKRLRESDDDPIEDAHQRSANTEPSHATPAWPSEVVQHLASFLLVSVDEPTDPDSTQRMRVHLVAIARMSQVNTHWRHALSDAMDAHCARYARLFVLDHTPRSDPIDSDEDGRPQLSMPAVFEDMDAQHLASAVRDLLKHVLRTDRSHFVAALVVRALLPGAAHFAQTPGVPPDDRDGMQRLPLTILAFAFQHGLSGDPRRFNDVVSLLVAHWNRFPLDVQVRMNEDLESIEENGNALHDDIKRAWQQTMTTELLEAVKLRRKRLDALNTRSARDARGARLYALKEMTSLPWYPSSPTRILALSWIARHWDNLSCLENRVQQRQTELETKVLELFNEVAESVDVSSARSHAEFLVKAFPAPLRKLVLERMDHSSRNKLLRGIEHEADTLPPG